MSELTKHTVVLISEWKVALWYTEIGLKLFFTMKDEHRTKLLQPPNGCSPNYIKQKTGNQVLEKNNQNTNKREMLITGRSIKTDNILEVKHSAHLWLDNLVSELTGL